MLEWNVYIGGFNSGVIEVYNVFTHGGFLEDCRKAAREYAKDREGFERVVRRSLMYHFWSKCEWEIIIDHWPHSDRKRDLKTDVYDQVVLNWDRFAQYVWDHAVELRRREKT